MFLVLVASCGKQRTDLVQDRQNRRQTNEGDRQIRATDKRERQTKGGDRQKGATDKRHKETEIGERQTKEGNK